MHEQMTRIQTRIEEMEKTKAAASSDIQAAQTQTPVGQLVASPAKPAAPKSPTTFTSGDWTFKRGGVVKLHLFPDFNAIGSTDTVHVRTIPLHGRHRTGTRMHARETRLSLCNV